MSNVVCCLTKCALISPKSVAVKHSVKTNQESCQKNLSEMDNDHSCCISDNENQATDRYVSLSDLKTGKFQIEKDSIFTTTNDFQCKMICCLPSDQIIDITQVSQINPAINVNKPHIGFSTNIVEKNKYSALPVEKFINQDQTYLRCCVFLI
jgi:hypothetical protein